MLLIVMRVHGPHPYIYMTIVVGTDAGTKQNDISYDRVLCAVVICRDRTLPARIAGDMG